MNLDEDAYCRVCCFLQSKGLPTDKFTLHSNGNAFELKEWNYDIPRPTEAELMSVSGLENMKKMTTMKLQGISKLVIMTQEEVDMYEFQEGEFVFNTTSGFIELFVEGRMIKI